jgi:hypothetical protein
MKFLRENKKSRALSNARDMSLEIGAFGGFALDELNGDNG